jgi:hypothetical protein
MEGAYAAPEIAAADFAHSAFALIESRSACARPNPPFKRLLLHGTHFYITTIRPGTFARLIINCNPRSLPVPSHLSQAHVSD